VVVAVENLCHDNEHQRYTEELAEHGIVMGKNEQKEATNNPFANLKDLINK